MHPSGEPRDLGLAVEDLRVDLAGTSTDVIAEALLSVPGGLALGVVGESGSGKTTLGLGMLGYARPGTAIRHGAVRIGDRDILALREGELRGTRGTTIAYVPQNPSRALSPGMRIGRQLDEVIETERLSAQARRERVGDALAAAQLPTDDAFLRRYPHQLSGGQIQRVAIAMALIGRPGVIVMDEPTTGLDVITQARLLDVIRRLRAERAITLVYISHDLGVVRSIVDRVAVVYGGRVVEEGPVEAVFAHPAHPYTRRLLEAIPRVRGERRIVRGLPGGAPEPGHRPAGCVFVSRCEFAVELCHAEAPPRLVDGARADRCRRRDDVLAAAAPSLTAAPRAATAATGPLLRLVGVSASYRARSERLLRRQRVEPVVHEAALEVPRGGCVAIVGESGSGKTTLARVIAGLHEPDAGEMTFDGEPLAGSSRERSTAVRRQIQIVFQDPESSLNPRMTVRQILQRPLMLLMGLDRAARTRRIAELLESVRLPAAYADRYPRQLSGGEKQRVALARALAAEPALLVCDEVTSALDVVVQAGVLELLVELRRELDMAVLFISHDLGVVRAISDEVVVMQQGRIREGAATESLFAAPQHEYTRALLAAVPDLGSDDYPRLARAAVPIAMGDD